MALILCLSLPLCVVGGATPMSDITKYADLARAHGLFDAEQYPPGAVPIDFMLKQGLPAIARARKADPPKPTWLERPVGDTGPGAYMSFWIRDLFGAEKYRRFHNIWVPEGRFQDYLEHFQCVCMHGPKWERKLCAEESNKRARARAKQRERERLEYIPMLPACMEAIEYDQKHLPPKAIVQPKMDGCRIRVYTEDGSNTVFVMSKNNTKRQLWEGLQMDMSLVLKPGWIIEGEFYSNATPPRPWQELCGLFRRKKEDWFLKPEFADVAIVWFDMFMATGRNEPYHKRYEALKQAFKEAPVGMFLHGDSRRYRVVESAVAKGHDEVDKLFKHYVGQGYEGVVVRDPTAPYVPNRTTKMMKLKQWHDIDLEIEDLLMAPFGVQVVCKGGVYAAWNIGNRETAAKTIEDKASYVGRVCTVMYTDMTKNGSLRSALYKGLRTDLEPLEEDSEEDTEDML